MKKILVLLIATHFFNFINAQNDYAITQEITDINENFEVIVTISFKINLIKDIDMKMFARFKESVADKCDCQFIETSGADTEFKKNLIKFIWLENKLPNEDFKIVYKLKFNKMPVNRCIDGFFNYITINNKRELNVVEGKKCFDIKAL